MEIKKHMYSLYKEYPAGNEQENHRLKTAKRKGIC